jgi:hypothetical protein
VTELLAVLALDLGIVSRLRALLEEVSFLIAVAARHVGWVLRLITLFGDMVL